MTITVDGKEVHRRRRALPGSPSVRAFAKAAKINFVTVSRIESGRAGASVQMIEKLARALRCEPRDISRAVEKAPSAYERLEALENDFVALEKRIVALEGTPPRILEEGDTSSEKGRGPSRRGQSERGSRAGE